VESNEPVAAYADAAAALLAMPVGDERRASVIAALARLAAFAADIDACELSVDVEIAGVFAP
jgi:hypothetical protein